MQGSSRAAAAAGQRALDAALAARPDLTALAGDLFAVAAAIDGNATLRRALTDPTREGRAKSQLASTLLLGKVGSPAVGVVAALVSERWSSERDLTDTIEGFAVQAVAAGAETARRVDAVEDELFRFERIVAGDPALRDAVTDRNRPADQRRALVEGLLADKVSPETLTLATQAAAAPRGRRFADVVGQYLQIIATRREQLSATVTSAVELATPQRVRLGAALQRIYGKPVHLNVVVDPSVVGGIRIEVGDEVVDGTVLRRLEGARRHLGT